MLTWVQEEALEALDSLEARQALEAQAERLEEAQKKALGVPFKRRAGLEGPGGPGIGVRQRCRAKKIETGHPKALPLLKWVRADFRRFYKLCAPIFAELLNI